MWSQKSSDLSDNGSVKSLKDNSVRYLQKTVNEDNIDCSTETFNNFDFENCAIEGVFFIQLLWNSSLTLVNQVRHEIRKTFTRDGWCWYETNKFIDIFVLPIQAGIETLFSKSQGSFFKSILELIFNEASLISKRILDSVVFLSFPLVTSIDLVESDNERTFLLSEELYWLESLLFKSMHQIDDQDGDITQRWTSASQVGERFVSWGINYEESR